MASSSCARLVVRDIQAVGGLDVITAPALGGVLYTLPVVSLMIGRSENAISILLCRHRAEFDDRHYRRGHRNRLERLLTAGDVERLRRQFYPIIVKPK